MKVLRILSRIVIGLTFIFSGVVKAIDPLGSSYKFHDYFQVLNIGFLNSLCLPLAILLCTAEFAAGFSVLTGLRQKTGITIVMILLTIFTPVTFLISLTNPVSDCGCFGDAVHLTNWQTFGKNIILLALTIVLLINKRNMKQLLGTFKEWLIIFAVIILFILFSLYNLRYLPVIDFLPYKTGVKIADNMVLPDGKTGDEFLTTFIYEKDGIKKEFSLNNYPSKDTSWKFVEQKSILLNKGFQASIHGFSITSMGAEDITQKILSYQGYTVLMITNKLSDARENNLADGFKLGIYCIPRGIEFYILTSSGAWEQRNYLNGIEFCSVDETTLKSMVRSNPGYILIKDGTIIGKWSWANVPEKEWFGRQVIQSFIQQNQ
jgi:hypothetical protein